MSKVLEKGVVEGKVEVAAGKQKREVE